MPKFTAFDATTRLILYSGTTGLVSALPHTAFEGVAADPATYRVKADLSGVEEKPALGAVVTPLSLSAGDFVSVTVTDPVNVSIDGTSVGQIESSDSIEFASAGSYQLRLEPVSQLLLPQTETITVT